jgi:formylglycine-generating enzyme required for sulfatase activity
MKTTTTFLVASPGPAVLLLVTLLLLSMPLFADTLAQQGFEASPADTWDFTAVPEGMTRLIWWGRSDQPMGGANAQSGSWYWASWDLDNTEHSLTFASVALPAGYIHSLSFWYFTNGLNPATDHFRYCVEYDAGTQWTNWVDLSPDTDAWTQVVLDVPPYATTLRLKLAASYDGFAKYAHWDGFALTNTPMPPLAPLIYNASVAQRLDGSKLVDIHYDIFDANNDPCTVSLQLSSDNGVTFSEFPNQANLSGDLGDNVTNGSGKHIVWNAGADGVDYDGSQYRIRILADDNSMPENFILVEGGTFNNGTSDITISSFYIDKYELTQAGYQAVMGVNPSYFTGVANGPVERVTWFNAIEYCNRRSLQEELTPCYSYSTYGTNPDNWPSGWNTSNSNHTNVNCNCAANGYRLPTEMEWMFAAKGGNLSQGYTYSGSNNLNLVGWYNVNSGGTSHTVGTKAPNELDTLDMSGNITEWVWDIYGSYPIGPQTDPHGATSGYGRVQRGGSWYFGDGTVQCTVSYRNTAGATYSLYDMGFRVSRISP